MVLFGKGKTSTEYFNASILRTSTRGMDVDVRKRGDQVDELGAGGGAPVDAGRGPYQGGCRNAVPPGVRWRRETTEETQAGGGGRRDDEDYLGCGHG